MKIYCSKCDRTMSVSELFGYAGGCFVKILGKNGALLLLAALKEYLTPTRFLDFKKVDGLVGIVNACQVECPQCKQVGSWNSQKINSVIIEKEATL
ncbi:MAG: phage FluMu protein Com [Alteromonas naphthalenivorans]|jgi:phage FluMu protein Com